jgi:hypothetical protein
LSSRADSAEGMLTQERCLADSRRRDIKGRERT